MAGDTGDLSDCRKLYVGLEETDRFLEELVQKVGEPPPQAISRAEALSRRIRRDGTRARAG